MDQKADQFSVEEKWAMTAQAMTGTLAAHMHALYCQIGKENYEKVVRDIWSLIGQQTAEFARSMGPECDNAGSVGEAGVTMCKCSMGPEYEMEEVKVSEDRFVMKITKCPFKNRMNEAGISVDLLSAADRAFWDNFVKTLNPKVRMRHGKQMHRGDPYCEWIFETKRES